jgi:hypothetical protein
VSSFIWELSGTVMKASQATRGEVEKHLADQVDKTNRARGKAEGIRAVVAEEIREDVAVKRVSQNILRTLKEHGGKANRSDVRKRIAHRDRCYFDSALDALVTVGSVEVIREGQGETLVLTAGAL